MIIELMHSKKMQIKIENVTVLMLPLPSVWSFKMLALENLGIGSQGFKGRS